VRETERETKRQREAERAGFTTAQNMPIGQLTMQQLHILHWTFRFYNCTNCDQLHVKICRWSRSL